MTGNGIIDERVLVQGDDIIDEVPQDDDAFRAMVLKIVKDDVNSGRRATDSMTAYRSKMYNLYRARATSEVDGAEREGRSRIISSDVMDCVEWMMPSFMKAFAGGRNQIEVSPQGKEDIVKADKNGKLLNWQFMNRGNGFTVLYELIKAALVYGTSYAKVTWREDFVRKGFHLPEVLEPQMEEMMSDPTVEEISAGSVEDVEQVVGVGNADIFGIAPPMIEQFRVYRDVRGEQRIITYSGPKVEVLPPEEVLVDPEAKSLDEALYVIHRIKRTISYLREREREGVYSNISEVIEHAGKDKTRLAEESMRFTSAGDQTIFTANYSDGDQVARKKVEVFEWWGYIDTRGNGIAEPYLVVVAGETIIRMERNPYAHGLPPFVEVRPILDLFRFHGIGMSELVGEFQQVKTSLMRQILDNLSFQNNQMWEVDENAGVDVESLINPRPGGVVFTNFLGKGFRQITPQPLGAAPLQMMEFMQTQLEQRSGVTRYNQGLDARSLNKMLALDTPILLIDGSYKENKDVVEGDVIVGSDGNGTTVTCAHPIQMPERAFEIEFKSGDVIRAGGEHRWSVKVSDKKYRNLSDEWEPLPTTRIFELMEEGYRVWIPRVGDVDFTEKELIIPPYLLGIWLGDGHSHTNRFTTADQEVVDAFSEWASTFYKGRVEACKQLNSGKATVYQLVNTPIREMLKDLKLLKDKRYDDSRDNVKHIPEIYLQGSHEQRLELMRGLMDSDGCIDKNGNATFCNSEPALIESFVGLVESLGGEPNIHWNETPKTQYENARPHAHVTFSMPHCPVKLAGKAERWKTNEAYWERQAIVSIREIEPEPMRCLTVDADDELYVCGRRLTLTLNTATGISAIMNASAQRIELIARIMGDSIRRMYKMMLELNQQFIDQDLVVRIFNEELDISPDDLAGNFDVQVDIGGATGKEDQKVEQIVSILQYATMLMNIGVMMPNNIYECVKEVMEMWGWKDYDRYIADPQIRERLVQAVQILEQLGMAVQQGQVPDPQSVIQALMQVHQLVASVAAIQEGETGHDGDTLRELGERDEGGGTITGILDPHRGITEGTGTVGVTGGLGGFV